MSSPEIRSFARRLRNLEVEVRRKKQPTLGFSTIDGGAIQAVDETGTLTMVVGQQFDGTNTASVVTGPTPPQPTLPLVVAPPGALRVYWDGTFVNGVAPMDFARVLAYAEPIDTYDGPDPLNQALIIGEFNTATGAEITAALPGGIEYVVYLVTWTQAGKFGTASQATTAMPGFAVSSEDVAAKASIYRQDTAPWPNGDPDHADDIGDLWFNTSLGPGELWTMTHWSVTSGEVTATLEGEHDMVVGGLVTVTNTSQAAPVGSTVPTVEIVGLEGTWTITAVTASTISFVPETVFPDSPIDALSTGIAQGQDVKPLNRPSVWDGSAWQVVQDSDLDNASTLAPQAKTNQQSIATLQNTAYDAYQTAYAADGRISISDYEPTPADVIGKQEGSMWITRTRDRLNLCTNPSFEEDLTGWSASGATFAQVSVEPAGDGVFAAEVTNSALAEDHFVTQTARYSVSPGQSIIASAYFSVISGAATGYFVRITWYDASSAVISTTSGASLDVDVWDRLYATDVAPTGAVEAQVDFVSSNASAVWQIDAVLVEGGSRLGRYFDGGSEGGEWLGDPENSTSQLDGNAIIRFFTLENSAWTEKFWTADTIKSVSASSIDRGQMDGAFIRDNSIAVDKAYVPEVPAGEDLTAGDLVHVKAVSGIAMAYRADASSGRRATGFVLASTTTGGLVKVYSSGYNPLMSSMVPGQQWLGDGGSCHNMPPTMIPGVVVQKVGIATDEATLVFLPTNQITIF